MVGFCEPVSSNINSSESEELKIGNVNTVEVRPLTGEERVKEYDFSQCVEASEEDVNRLKRILAESSIIFEDRPNGSTAVGLLEHEIELIDPTVKPLKQYAYRVNPTVGEKQKEFIEEMLAAGVIHPSKSPWASPVVCVPKADGTQRFCTDFRRLNTVIKSDVFPLPRIDDLLDRMGGCRFFSTLDLKSAFWQIPIASRSQELTAFVCQGQLYEYAKTPFGLKTSPAVFQRNMELVVEGLSEFASAYLDDLIVYSVSKEDHLKHIEDVLQRLVKHNLQVKLSKCRFFTTEVAFLGHTVSAAGIAVSQKKVRAIVEMRPPTNVKELRSFLGMANYYRRFVENYSQKVSSLNRLLCKGVEFDIQ